MSEPKVDIACRACFDARGVIARMDREFARVVRERDDALSRLAAVEARGVPDEALDRMARELLVRHYYKPTAIAGCVADWMRGADEDGLVMRDVSESLPDMRALLRMVLANHLPRAAAQGEDVEALRARLARGGRCTASRDGYACARETGHDGMHNNFGGRWAEAPKSPAPTCPRCDANCPDEASSYGRAPASAAAPWLRCTCGLECDGVHCTCVRCHPPKPEATREAVGDDDAPIGEEHPVDTWLRDHEGVRIGRDVRRSLHALVAAACRRAREEAIEEAAKVCDELAGEGDSPRDAIEHELAARRIRALAAKETT